MVHELLLCARHGLTLEATEYVGHRLSSESLHSRGGVPGTPSGRRMLEQAQERAEAFQAEEVE